MRLRNHILTASGTGRAVSLILNSPSVQGVRAVPTILEFVSIVAKMPSGTWDVKEKRKKD
jgi:hypothetical protein